MRTTPLASARVMTMKPIIRSGLILIVLPSAVVVFVVFAVLIVVVVPSKYILSVTENDVTVNAI